MEKRLGKILLVYASISYGVTWAIAAVIYCRLNNNRLSTEALNIYHACAAVGPAVGALAATYFFYGRAGLQKLARRLTLRNVGYPTWFLLLSPLVLLVVGVVAYAVVKAEWYSFRSFALVNWPSGRALGVWILPLLTYAVFEEIGWRGFLLPHLQQKYAAGKSTIILTLVWAVWHLPFFYYRFDFSLAISVGFFFSLAVGAVMLTSIYNASGGYLLPAIGFHLLNNICSGFEQEVMVSVVGAGFAVLAVLIYVRWGGESLSPASRTKNYFDAPSSSA